MSSAGVPGSSTGGNVPEESGPEDDQRFSIVDMAVLGGVLGALLLLALLGLAILIHKQYGHRLSCCSGKAAVRSLWEPGPGRVEEERTGERQTEGRRRRGGAGWRHADRWTLGGREDMGQQGMVLLFCNLSNLGGLGQRLIASKPASATI